MPRVVRNVIRITRMIRPPEREPPDDDPAQPLPDAQLPIQAEDGMEMVEWQMLIVIHLLPDRPQT